MVGGIPPQMRVTGVQALTPAYPEDHTLPPRPTKPQGGGQSRMCLMILIRMNGMMRCGSANRVRKGHQPRQPVRRGIQHPKFTELDINNSASFLSVLPPASGRALPSVGFGLKFHVSVMVLL